ncbi:MAG: hypothetical protein ACM362_12390 [Candidatus Methylomirabilota bacterium]
MLATDPACDQTGPVTGTPLKRIRQREATTDGLLRANAALRAEVTRLDSENTELRAGLAGRSREDPS